MIRFDDSSTLDDATLLELNGTTSDNEYLGILFVRYMPLVYGVCLKYLRNSDAAEDATAAIYEEVARKAGRYEIRTWRTWLYSVTKNYCLAQLSRRGTYIEINESVMEFEPLDTLSEEQKEERLTALERCLEKLPEKQRECIREFYFNNRSYADIVAQTRLNLNTVKSNIQNGRRNLKICVEKN